MFSCVYTHPKVKHTVFKESICQMADLLLQSYTDLVFLGDMNIYPTKSPVISELCDLYGLHNLIDQPTCFKGATPSVIDVILVTNRKKYSGVLNCNCHISDVHNFIGAATRRYAPLRKPRHIFYRSYKNFDDTEFCSAVSSAPFHVCEIFDDIEDMAWFTSSLLSTIINEHAPMKRKLVKQESVPYMNARLRKAMYRPIAPQDINNSHRLPKPRNAPADQPHPIIIRFTRKADRDRVLKERKELKKFNEDKLVKIYINEDLTTTRARLFAAARNHQKNGRLQQVWTFNGNIKVKTLTGVVRNIKYLNDINSCLSTQLPSKF